MVQEPKKLSPEQEDRLVNSVFSSSAGVKVLDILTREFYARPSYNASEQQPFATFFREGERNVVGFIKEVIERCQNQETKIGVTPSLKV